MTATRTAPLKTAAQVQADQRAKRKARGAKQINVWLGAEQFAALKRLQRERGLSSHSETIRHLLAMAGATDANAPAEAGASDDHTSKR